jgi:hypothetical protein
MSTATNNLVKTLSEINPEDIPVFSSTKDLSMGSNGRDPAYSSSSSSSIMSFFSDITWQTWLIIILLLAFLGINVFAYLQKGTDVTANLFDKFAVPVLKLFGYETLETTKQTVNTSATGTKAGVDAIADTTTGAINTVESTATTSTATTSTATTSGSNKTNDSKTSSSTVTGKEASTSLNMKATQPIQDQLKLEKQINELEDAHEQNLQRALEDASKPDAGPKPDDSLSRIQSGSSGKSGWCFIGEDRGFRTCSEVGLNDKCMSGDIFPSQQICMNPNLRP